MLRLKLEGEPEAAERAMSLLMEAFDVLEAHKFEEGAYIKMNLTLEPKQKQPPAG